MRDLALESPLFLALITLLAPSPPRFNALLPGTVVPPGRLIPRGEVWGGNPAKFVGTFGDPDKDALQFKVRPSFSENSR